MRGTKARRVTVAAAAGQTLAMAAPRGGGNAGRGGHCAGDLSQEQILDLVVEAMLARGGPGAEDDDLGDGDGVDASLAGSLWGTRDAAGPQDTGDRTQARARTPARAWDSARAAS